MEVSRPSKNEIKFIKSLAIKKYRYKNDAFIVEGLKSVTEFIHSDINVQRIFLMSHLLEEVKFDINEYNCTIVDEKGIKSISAQENPAGILAIVEMPKYSLLDRKWGHGCTLLLDNVQDPGNLGTLIRLADWFDLKQVVCSVGTVDCFNAKVVQSSMGSLARIPVFYTDLVSFLEDRKNIQIFSAVLGGQNLYQTNIKSPCFLILGNEANGINIDLKAFSTTEIEIPKMGKAESLNVAIAGGIILSEFQRQLTQQ